MSRDALKTYHVQQPQATKVNTKQICQLYMYHSCVTTQQNYIGFTNKLLYIMDPDEVTSDSEDNEPMEMPSPNASPEPSSKIPSNLPSPNTSPDSLPSSKSTLNSSKSTMISHQIFNPSH